MTRSSEHYFWVVLLLSALVHIAVAAGLGSFLPKHAQFLPLPSLNVKLGSEELEKDLPKAEVLVPPPTMQRDVPLTERAVRQLDKMLSTNTSPKQYVRERTPAPEAPKQAGAPLGNTQQTKAEKLTAYTQTLSLWMQKFKVYTDEARAKGLEGSAVVRIRIDRSGNIIYVSFRQRTGSTELDNAVLQMVERANPVPPVPADYPVDDPFLEFLIPISFTLGN